MTDFNLLPWREYRENNLRQKIRKALFFTTSLHLLIWAGITLFFIKTNHHIKYTTRPLEIEYQSYQLNSLDNSLDGQTEALNEWKTKTILQEKLLAVLFAIGSAKHREIPICFNHLFLKEEGAQFDGYTASTSDMMHFLRSWSVMQKFNSLQIEKIERHSDGTMIFRWHGNEFR